MRVAHHAVVDAWRERERQLIARGNSIRLLSAGRWNEGGRSITLDPGEDDFVEGVSTVGSHPNGFLMDPRPIWRLLKRRPDIIDLHEEPFALVTAEILLLRALQRHRAPYVLYSAQNIDKRYPVPIRWFERWALRGASAVHVCNREAGEILKRKGMRGETPLIPLGVDLDSFGPDVTKTAPADAPVVGYVGRLEAHKGVEHLVRAVATLAGWRLEITGAGADRDRLQRLAVELGVADRVLFAGFATGAELADRYRRMDVLCVPSVPTPGWLEQFGRVAVEAMACGVPVVASRTGALPDVVGDAGLLSEPADAVDLARALAEAVSVDAWTRLRENGLTRAAQFTWEEVARSHDALYRRVVPANDRAAADDPVVVVVAYGDPGDLDVSLECLNATLRVVIVDNSSSRETAAVAARHGATYIDPGTNLGFGAGVNVALASLRADGDVSDVLLLNPDARVTPAGVRRMHKLLHESPSLAAVGAIQSDPDSGEEARVWWPFPHPLRAWVEAIGLGALNRGRGFAIGSVLMLRSEALAAVGDFDERFFLYAEEVDWQKRARDEGWRIAVADAAATHVGGATSSDGDVRDRLFHASAETYIRKHFGRLGWLIYRAALITGSAARAVALTGERREQAARRRDLYLQGPVRAAKGLRP